MNFLKFAKDYGKFLLKDKRGFWGGVASAIGGIAGGALNYASQQGTNQKTIDLWREQAAYNTPVNQMARYQAAGLNPNLVVSQGNPGNMASSPSLTAPKFDYDPSVAFQLDATLKNMRQQNKNLEAQNSLIHSQTALALQEARRMAYETDWLQNHGTSSFDNTYLRGAKSLFDFAAPAANFLGDSLGSFVGKLRPKSRLVPRSDNSYHSVR